MPPFLELIYNYNFISNLKISITPSPKVTTKIETAVSTQMQLFLLFCFSFAGFFG